MSAAVIVSSVGSTKPPQHERSEVSPQSLKQPSNGTTASATVAEGAYYDMLSQLGHHLEDIGSMLVAHSLPKSGTAMDLLVTPADVCCSISCTAPQGAKGAGMAQSSSFKEAATTNGIFGIKNLDVVRQQLHSKLVTTDEQQRNRTLWELAAGLKNSPPPQSPWLFDNAVARQNPVQSAKVDQALATNLGFTTVSLTDEPASHGFPKSLADNLGFTTVSLNDHELQGNHEHYDWHKEHKAIFHHEPVKTHDPHRHSVATAHSALDGRKPYSKKKLLIGNGRHSITRGANFGTKDLGALDAAKISLAIGDGSKQEHPTFHMQDTVVSMVIMLNAVVMGISADIHWEEGWQNLEYAFTAFFLLDMLSKMCRLGIAGYFCGREWHWNTFDFIVVLIGVGDVTATIIIEAAQAGDSVDLSKFTAVKLARLGRLARLVRLLRFRMFKELLLMFQGVFAGLRALFWAIFLFVALLLFLAMVIRNVYTDEVWVHVAEPFGSVPWAMFTLFRCFTDGCTAHDGTPLVVHLYRRFGGYFMVSYCLVFLFVSIGLFNLITAIFLDEVMESTRQKKMNQREKDYTLLEQRLREVVMKVIKRCARMLNELESGAEHACSSTKARAGSKISKALQFSPKLDQMLEKFPGAKMVLIECEHLFKACCCCCCSKGPEKKKDEQDFLWDEDEDDDGAAFEALPRDAEGKLIIEREIFNLLIEDPVMDDMLEHLDVSTSNRWELFDVLDSDMSGNVDLEELIVGLMSMRGPAEKSDIVAGLLCSRNILQSMQEFHEDHETFADHVMSELCAITSKIELLAVKLGSPDKHGH